MRLFVALNFSEEVKDALLDSISRLKEAAVRGNFTRRENLHLTLAFIGETDRADAVKRAMDAAQAPAFDLFAGGFGKFRRGGGCIYWTGVKKTPALESLQSKLCTVLEEQGFDMEKRNFRPHITLGRNVEMPASFDEEGFAKSVQEAGMRVGHISLMKSEHTGGRLVYTEIYRKRLESGPQ